MVFPESKNIGNGNGKQASPPQPPQAEESLKDPSFSPLSEQNSLLSLTLNEIQVKRGKSFGSMNMDEFLANLWTVDENQVPSQPIQNKPSNNVSMVNQPTLTREGSFSIPAPLSKKTVDEVWFDIQKDQTQYPKPNNISPHHEPPQRQQTFGEITLEDFLVKAGVVQEAPAGSSKQKMIVPIQNTNTCLDVNFGIGHMIGLGFSAHNQTANGFATYQMFPQVRGYVGEAANNCKIEKGHSLMELGVQQNKRRIIDGPSKVVVERRQRRMIKNRESAARSRARKQVLH